jgi:cation transport regulator
MPYDNLSDLPDNVKALPKHAQEIYQAAFNSAWEQHKEEDGAEARCHAIAWAAVKEKFKKNTQGDWVAKESKESKEAVHPHGEHVCVCPKCETEITVAESVNCNTQDCPECGTRMRAKDVGERRESAGSIGKLQSKYSEIIQEAGRRNAAQDAARIKKIVELCQELLSSEEPEESKTKEALKEADKVLAWLKEQKAMKTEDGVQYPAEAYAYVPDSEKPSTWKLRLWEDPQKKITLVQLGRAAAALSPGGFRGQRVEISRDDLAAVKRKIRAEYRKLDVEDEDIPKWVKEAEVRTLLADYVPLEEATVTSKGIATIVVIKPGLNSSKERYYPPEVLARDYAVFEGVKMYADHPTDDEEKQRPERSIKDWVATLKNVHVD